MRHLLRTYFRGYRRRIVVSLILFLLVIFLPLVLYGILTDRALIAESIENTGRYLVKNLAQNSELGVFAENRGYLHTPLQAITEQEDVAWAAVYNLKGDLILSEQKLAGFDLSLPAAVRDRMPQLKDLLQQRAEVNNRTVSEFFFPVFLRPGMIAPEYDETPAGIPQQQCIGIARVGLTLDWLRQRTIAIMLTALLLGVVCLGVGLFTIWFVTRAITLPVRQLETAVRQIGSGDLDVRIGITADDEIGHLARSFNDMADRLQDQMRRREQAEDRMRRLILAVEQAEEMVVVLDRDGFVQYANPATGRVVGLDADAIIGQNPFKPQRNPERAAVIESVWREVSAGRTWSGSLLQKLFDGSDRALEQTVTPVRDDAGDIVGFVAIGRDVTHERMIEERLRQAQKMEAIGTLAGGIAHDFNNILAAILGYTELSLAQHDADPKITYNLEQILKAGNRAADLVRQILAFSRKSMQEQKPLELNRIVKDAAQLLRATIPTTIDLRLSLPKEPVVVSADAGQVHQVVMNLCTNAAQAIGERPGRIDVTLAVRMLSGADIAAYPDLKEGEYAQLTVKDSGPGIPPGVIEHIFEPFFTTKPVHKGTGMGLAVVDGIVKSHRGFVTVASTPGQGTTFDVFIPRITYEPGEQQRTEELLLRGTERILFVDDEAFLVDTQRKILEGLGYRVTALQSSTEALAMITADPERFDLVVTDQTMPDMTGLKLARAIREIKADLPVILCSGYSDAVTPESATAEGIRAFLYKPVDKQTLARAVRQALDGHKDAEEDRKQKSGVSV